jgi:hypothetical protein
MNLSTMARKSVSFPICRMAYSFMKLRDSSHMNRQKSQTKIPSLILYDRKNWIDSPNRDRKKWNLPLHDKVEMGTWLILAHDLHLQVSVNVHVEGGFLIASSLDVC